MWELILFSALTAAMLLWPVALTFSIGNERVSRKRLAQFAVRHSLVITPDNGNRVIAYLATTRRWRCAGLVAAYLLVVFPYAIDMELGANPLMLLAGWFVGALIAEARIVHLAHGQRRAAALLRRTPRDYLPAGAWSAVLVCAALGVLVAGATVYLSIRREGVDRTDAALWLILGLSVAVLVRLGQRYVLGRPQPLATPDVLAADDAIRSRSLHVMTGAGVALVLYCVMGQIRAVRPALPDNIHDAAGLAQVVGGILVPIIGFAMATARWPVLREPAAPAATA